MTAVVTRNPRRAAGSLPAAPTHPDGRPYRFAMIHNGGGYRAFADTGAELVDVLIPGYAALQSEQGRREARIDYAARVQVAVQAAIVSTGDIAGCSDTEVRTLLAPRDTPPAPATWAAPVPLVLVSSFYTPTGFAPRPRVVPPAEILWLDPEDDYALLRSLHSVGAIDFAEHTTYTPESPGPAQPTGPTGTGPTDVDPTGTDPTDVAAPDPGGR